MEHFTNGVTAAIGTALLFFMTFTSCVKTSAPANTNMAEKMNNVYQVEYSEHSLRKSNYHLLPVSPERKAWPQHRQKSQASISNTSFKNKDKVVQPSSETLMKEKESTAPVVEKSSDKGTIALASVERMLDWLRLLPFIPLAIGVGLMRRKMKAMQQEKADTIVFLGGLISLLIVILLIVLIINLI